ncbi:taste receptor type 2 member 40-like [Rana temporaria]|uniref:taste receptor type 2 member 40-like n=1 Tax=Rana temporaria TaxID=8407 RepID=UPI001AACBE73|nr:taste receptor type 2 member 40-like [Rana temporaria]
MASAGAILLAVTIALQTVTGITLNSCITAFSFKSRKNGSSFHPTNLIFSIMGLVNIFLQFVLTAQNIIYTFWPCWFFMRELSLSLSVLTQCMAYCSFWLTGWLCAYYCVNIVNLGHPLIARLQRLLSSFLPHVLVMSIIGPFLLGVLSIWMAAVVEVKPSSNHTGCIVGETFNLNAAYRAITTFLGCCLPFFLALISTGITISSLIRHINKTKNNVSGYTPSSLQSLIHAAKTMVLFLVLSVIFYVFALLFSATITNTSAEAMSVLSSFIIMSFPLTEAVIIIQAVPKLRKKIRGNFCCEKESGNKTEENN